MEETEAFSSHSGTGSPVYIPSRIQPNSKRLQQKRSGEAHTTKKCRGSVSFRQGLIQGLKQPHPGPDLSLIPNMPFVVQASHCGSAQAPPAKSQAHPSRSVGGCGCFRLTLSSHLAKVLWRVYSDGTHRRGSNMSLPRSLGKHPLDVTGSVE